ncbi:MAG: NAD+ synthase [Rhodospirillales bacterium]|nr:NAD+ synthase [Rhodospirillales bacterium]
MNESFGIALAQLNPTVGDIDGNIGAIRDARARAAGLGAELMVTGELAVAGYPLEDLVLKRSFQKGIEAAVKAFTAETADGGPAVLLGTPWRVEGKLYNAALLLDDGKICAVTLKHELPNYGVFDEKRVFAAGELPKPVEFRGVRLGVMICEDMWVPRVAGKLAADGTDILVVLNGSPFEFDKPGVRAGLARDRVGETGLPVIYVNLVGGQDELVFDGNSFVLDANGDFAHQMKPWDEDLQLTEWRVRDASWGCATSVLLPGISELEAIYRALVTGLRDYVEKNGFPGVVLGLSGGIDSALSAAIAVDALGPERVKMIAMPSPYTSRESIEDAEQISDLLGASLESISIEPAMQAFQSMLGGMFAGRDADATEENIQARARAVTLMAVSNKFGDMLLTTGNKSEMSVGYATIYGDMCGGYSVLKDVYKMTVFALSRWRNGGCPEGGLGPGGPVMPERVITKPPSAELKPDQTDQDTLPPYEDLDAILGALVEGERSVAEVVKAGYDEATVRRIWRMLDMAEYKRRQAPPGVKISHRAFGRDRRYPITNRFTF